MDLNHWPFFLETADSHAFKIVPKQKIFATGRFSDAELTNIAERVRDDLQRLPDAAKVEVHGAQEERVFIEYGDAVLAELDYSPHQLSQALATRDIVLSGGEITLGDERIALQPSGNFESIADTNRLF